MGTDAVFFAVVENAESPLNTLVRIVTRFAHSRIAGDDAVTVPFLVRTSAMGIANADLLVVRADCDAILVAAAATEGVFATAEGVVTTFVAGVGIAGRQTDLTGAPLVVLALVRGLASGLTSSSALPVQVHTCAAFRAVQGTLTLVPKVSVAIGDAVTALVEVLTVEAVAADFFVVTAFF